MRLNPKHYSLNELLQGRLFRIPDYQRAYSWTKKQRQDLFDDIHEVIETGRDHFMATVVGLSREKKSIGADEFSSVEIVDGQQRLTTFVLLLKTIEMSLDPTIDAEEKIKGEISALLVKGDDHSLILLQTNHDSSRVFLNFIRTGKVETKTASTAAEKNIIDAISECYQFVNLFDDSDARIKLVATLRNRLSMIFHEVDDESVVYRVFEVLNSRGLAVRWIDKLKSQLMARIFELSDDGARNDALNEMRKLWGDIYRIIGLNSALGDEALRFAGTIKSNARPNKILSQEDATASLVEAAGTSLSSITNLAEWVKEVVRSVHMLSGNVRLSAVTQIVHARFLAIAILLRDFDAKEKDVLLQQWENVTFRIFGLGNADSRNKVGDYVRLGYDVAIGLFEVDDIQEQLVDLGLGFEIDDVIDRVGWGDCYDGWTHELRYLLFRYDEHLADRAGEKINKLTWEKIWTADLSKTIEHIKPQKSNVSYVHELGNLAMLPPGVNSSLGAKLPVVKAETYIESGIKGTAKVGKYLKKQQKWGQKEVAQRSKELLEFIAEEWRE